MSETAAAPGHSAEASTREGVARDLKIDKSEWGDGAWQAEPDRVDFVHAGFACIVRRNHHGNLCGYVGVPASHPAYGKGYDDIDIDVHGGLTYANKCQGDVCHMAAPGMPDDVWWLGFDCAHAGDLSPGTEARRRAIYAKMRASGEKPVGYASWEERDETTRRIKETWPEVYRGLAYVRQQTERLAEQLAGMST